MSAALRGGLTGCPKSESGETFVRDELTHIEHGEEAVHLLLGVGTSLRVVPRQAGAFFIACEEKITQQGAVHNKTLWRSLYREEGITPGKLPHGKDDKNEIKKESTESCHDESFVFNMLVNGKRGVQSCRPALKRVTDSHDSSDRANVNTASHGRKLS